MSLHFCAFAIAAGFLFACSSAHEVHDEHQANGLDDNLQFGVTRASAPAGQAFAVSVGRVEWTWQEGGIYSGFGDGSNNKETFVDHRLELVEAHCDEPCVVTLERDATSGASDVTVDVLAPAASTVTLRITVKDASTGDTLSDAYPLTSE